MHVKLDFFFFHFSPYNALDVLKKIYHLKKLKLLKNLAKREKKLKIPKMGGIFILAPLIFFQMVIYLFIF
jgi:UDP-N-acetylmuramyl pentapeptide phosphotransferase/UDP-N-acetylglucosamine-1-phosphate transferase